MKNKFFKKPILILGLVLLFAIIPIIYFFKPITIEQFVFDVTHDNNHNNNYISLTNTLHSYPKIKFEKLPLSIQNLMLSKEINYIKLLKNLEFYEIPKGDIYKKIYFNNRIYNFISKEQIPNNMWFSNRQYFYFSLEDNVFKVAFDLSDILIKKGYDVSSIKINSAYRSPSHNDHVRGARKSMHLYGKALDIRIGDLNRDGRVNSNDKIIVYEILDKVLIENKGGLGFYPNTMILHYDLRGNRARWDNYKRK